VGEAANAETRRAAQRGRCGRRRSCGRIALAQALRHPPTAAWGGVQPDARTGLLEALLPWTRQVGVAAVEVPWPDGLRRQAKGSLDYPALCGPFRVPAATLAVWLAQAVGVQARQAAAGAGLLARVRR